MGNNFNILHGAIDFYLDLFIICPWNMSCNICNAFVDMHYNVVTPTDCAACDVDAAFEESIAIDTNFNVLSITGN